MVVFGDDELFNVELSVKLPRISLKSQNCQHNILECIKISQRNALASPANNTDWGIEHNIVPIRLQINWMNMHNDQRFE